MSAAAAVETRRGGRRSLEERRKTVAMFHARGNKSVEWVAEKVGVTTATVYQWVKQEREGTLHDPDNPTPRQSPVPAEVRSDAVAKYRADPTQASVIAHALGITVNKLYKWASREAKLSESTALAKTNGHAGKRARAIEVSAPMPMQQISLDEHPAMLTQELLRERHKTQKLKNMLISIIQEM